MKGSFEKKNTKLEIYFLFHCLFNKMAVFKEQFKHTKYTFNKKTSDEINKSEMILFLLVYKTMVYNDNNI